MLGQDGFRVKLHALDRQGFVAHAHDFAVFCPGGDFQAIRQAFALDHQRVVAGAGHRVGQTVKHAEVQMLHRRGLAVHQLLGVDDLATKRLADALVAQTHAKDGNLAGKALDGGHRHTGFQRRARAGGNHQVLRRQAGDIVQADFVVTEHLHILPQFAEVLHQVVGEGVIIVDHQQHVWRIPLIYLAK